MLGNVGDGRREGGGGGAGGGGGGGGGRGRELLAREKRWGWRSRRVLPMAMQEG
jgi:hypothetical protein